MRLSNNCVRMLLDGWIAVALVLMAVTGAIAAAAEPPATRPTPSTAIRIARFQGDKAAAISFTFDDGVRDQDDIAVPILDRLGFKATFFISPGFTPETDAQAKAKKPGEPGAISWQRLKMLHAQGHEIGNHAWTHRLHPATDTQVVEQVDRAYDEILARIGTPPLTFCYPGNYSDARIRAVVMRRHIAARETCFRYGGLKDTGSNAMIDAAIRDGRWLVAMIHAIEVGYDPFPSRKVFEAHLQYVKDHQTQIWVDTFANVARYVQERDAITLSVEKSGPTEVVFTAHCPLDPTVYDRPVTFIIAAKDARQVQATRQGIALPTKVEPDRIVLDALPSKWPIRVTWR